MASAFFSRRAEADLAEIGAYTLETWGARQARLYLDQIEKCCRRLAGNPGLGRACENVRPGLRRLEQGRHVIFYREYQGSILVLRVLHQSMLPEQERMEE